MIEIYNEELDIKFVLVITCLREKFGINFDKFGINFKNKHVTPG